MIECRVCHKGIAETAVTCPGCGAPNDWVHPEIERLALSIKQRNFLPPGSQVYWKAYRVWGTGLKDNPAREKHPLNWGFKVMTVGIALGLLGIINVMLLAVAFVVFLMGLVAGLIGSLSDDLPPVVLQTTFELDLSTIPPDWTCDDEDYWAEVRRFFKV